MAAPFITVSGNVTDPNGIPYAGGTITPILNVGGSPILLGGGGPYVPPIGPFALDNLGNFSFQLAANNQITPANSTWSFQISSAQGTVPIAFGKTSVTFTVPNLTLNASTNITSSIAAVVQNLTYSAGGGGGGAATALNFSGTVTPIAAPAPTTAGQVLEWNGSAWVAATVPTGTGTVTNVSSGNIATARINVTVANPTTTPAFSFVQQAVNASTFYGNPQTNSNATVGFFSLLSTSDVQFDPTFSTATAALLDVFALHFGTTQLPLASTSPTTGQVLQWNGTNIVGATIAPGPSFILAGSYSIAAQTFAANSVTRLQITTGVTGILVTDAVMWAFGGTGNVNTIAGWSTGNLTILGLQTGANLIQIYVNNPTSSGIAAGAVPINWLVVRP
jgi:hypothetical protein